MRNKRTLILLAALLLLLGGIFAYRELTHDHADDHGHAEQQGHAEEDGHAEEGHDHGGEEGHADETRLSDAALKELDIEVLTAGPAHISESIQAIGQLTLNEDKTAHVKARFTGPIRSVLRRPGEQVKAGDTLATVESNDSLQVYALTAPLAGIVVERNASVGDQTGDTVLFTISDLGSLWAEISVFSSGNERITAGQKLRIRTSGSDVSSDAVIALVMPATDPDSQALRARAVLDNSQGKWRAGTHIRAEIITSETEASLAVKTEALQRMEEKLVVFVREEDGAFKAQPVETGRSDGIWTEILSGLKAGDAYVARNSFIVKADIGKSAAAHEH